MSQVQSVGMKIILVMASLGSGFRLKSISVNRDHADHDDYVVFRSQHFVSLFDLMERNGNKSIINHETNKLYTFRP